MGRIKSQPLRIKNALNNPLVTVAAIKNFQEEKEYRNLLVEYKKVTGKHFKRNGWDMHNKHTKLQAIKIRLKQIQDRQDMRSIMEENRKKYGPDFNLL